MRHRSKQLVAVPGIGEDKRKTILGIRQVAIQNATVLDELLGNLLEPISKLCDEVGLQPTVFYRWQKEFFENGAAAFEQKRPTNHSADKERIALVRIVRAAAVLAFTGAVSNSVPTSDPAIMATADLGTAPLIPAWSRRQPLRFGGSSRARFLPAFGFRRKATDEIQALTHRHGQE